MKKFRLITIFILSFIMLAPIAASATQCCFLEGAIDTGPDASGFKSADYCKIKTSVCPGATSEVDCASQSACKDQMPICCIYRYTDSSKQNWCHEDADQTYNCSTIQPTDTKSDYKYSKCTDLQDCTGDKGHLFLSPTAPAAPPASKSEYPIIIPKLSIDIPTISMPDFTNVIQKDGFVYIPFISVYLVGAYKMGVGIAAILAVIMIMVGGFIWIAAAGDAGRIGQAKTMISGAVIGLILTVGSYIALQTVNPDLVNFTALKIPVVAPRPLINSDNTATDLTPADLSTPANGTGTVPLFKQFKYDSPYGACGTIKSSGCGPTSAAMVISSYGKSVDPPTMAGLFADNGFRICGQGTAYEAFTSPTTLNKFGMVGTSVDQDAMMALLRKNIPIIVAVGPSIFTKSGHFIVLTGIDPDGNITINDPNKTCYIIDGANNCSGHIPSSYILPNIKASFYIHPGS
jgi:Papain-like cysteine protease AvrRpt2.